MAIEKIPAIETCPEGTADGGHHCLIRELVPATRKCSDGFDLQDNTCHKRHEKPVKLECDQKGYKLDSSTGQCVGVLKEKATVAQCPRSVDTTPPDIFCKKGTLDPATGLCSVVVTENPLPTCPKSYRQDSENTCTRYRDVPAILRCPNGSISKHEHCYETLTSAPNVSCSKGFVLSPDGNCVRTQIRSYALICPEGYKLHSNRGVCVSKNGSTYFIDASSHGI